MTVELPSQTSIANNAISRIGSTERITSIEAPNSRTAERVRDFWPQLRRAMLVLHPFNFALWRADLNPASGPDLPALDDGVRAFLLPRDCLRWLPGVPGDRDYLEGEIEAGYLLVQPRWCGNGTTRVRYIRDVDDVTRWSPAFTDAFTEALAKLLAQPVTQSATMAQWLHDTAAEAVRTAKRIDGMETGRRHRGNVTFNSDWLTARNRSRFADHR